MKKLFPFLLFCALSYSSFAQSVALSVTTTPCHDDGVITASVTGLTPPLTVTWYTFGSSGTTTVHTTTGTTDAFTGYSGGPISASVTDGTGYASYSFGGAPPFTYSVTTAPAVCAALGSATVTVTGGTAPYTYQWFDLPTSTVLSTTNPASLPAGENGLKITDAAGCTYGTYATMDSAVFIESAPAFSVTVTTTTANCTNGTATVTGIASSAVMPVTYLWSNGATSASIGGLVMGDYEVTVTDAVGCTGSIYAVVDQAITISAPVTTTPATCTSTDGAVIAFGSGGVPPYSYLWSNGATTAAQTGIAGGSYGVTVTDANGCIGHSNAYVSISTPITVSYTTTASLCTSPTGTATLALAGGTAPYSILWYTTPPQTTTTATSLPAGEYSFNVTDAVGCVQSGSITVPPVHVINTDVAITPATCIASDGGISITPSGGTTPYTFSWSTGSTASSITGQPAGWYSVTITDAAGCNVTRNKLIPVYSPIGLGVSTTPASCIFNSDGVLHGTAIGGTAPYTYNWGVGTGSTVTGVPTGHYWLYVSDAAGCNALDYVCLGYDPSNTSCYCTISGTVYDDVNGNCVQDPGEAGIPDVQMSCSGHGYTYTDASGHYSFMVPSGSYTISQTIRTFYPLSPCQANNIPVTVTASTGCVTPVNFADAITPIHDMQIHTWDYTMPVPGHTYSQFLLISNRGTVTESSVLAGYKPDGQLFAPSFVPSAVFAGSPYWYNTSAGFPSLAPGTSKFFYLNYTVPTSIPMGTNVLFKDSVAYTAPMSNWLSDYTPWNNTNYFSAIVVSSYDPNFKEVSPKGTGPTGIIHASDSVLEYMVHFQNTGTYQATNVVVIDTLDDDLDWTSLSPTFQSATCRISLQPQGTYKIATFTFNDINLPPKSADDMRSNGLFSYTVKLKHGLAAGTQITNRASIYFDYNAPVLTNSTLNTLADATSAVSAVTNAQDASTFAIYPNPAQQSFSANINSETDGTADMSVSDVTGKILLSKTVTVKKGTQTISTNINQLSAGIYFVSFAQNGNVQTQKLVIAK